MHMYSAEGDKLMDPEHSIEAMEKLMAMQKTRAKKWSPEKVAKVEGLMAQGLGYSYSLKSRKL